MVTPVPPSGSAPVSLYPTPIILPIESDFLGAQDTTNFAEQHATVADQFIAELGQLAQAIVPPTITPVFPTNTNAPAISVPPPPSVDPIVYTPPPVPAPFTGTLTINDMFPNFTAGPPSLIFPNAPTPAFGMSPQQPAINTNFVYPTVSVDLPAAPALLSLDILKFNGVTLPTLSATAPVMTAVAPSIVQYIPNAPYTDALLSELTLTLKERLDIGLTGTNTGLPPSVEKNIWDRAREREFKAAGDAIVALDRMEGMGYSFPPGAFTDAQIKIQTELAYATLGLSRDIAIKQAELEQTNIKMAIESATAIESKLIDYANQTEQRVFEAAKYATDAGVAIYNAQVQAFAQLVNVYRAAIDIYVAQIQGAKLTVEIYQAELDAEKIKVDMNTALVQQYQVMVNAALASIQVFEGEIQIVKTQAEIEQLKVSIYGQEVQAYVAQINAFTAETEAYKAQIEAEQTKENVYATQAQVFKTEVEAVVAEINANVAVFKARLDEKTEEYDAYKAQVQGQTAQVEALAAQNKAVADIYTAEVSGSSAYNEALIKAYQVALDEAIQITQIGVAAAQANAQLYLTTKSIATDAAKVGAQVEAQIAASALGTVTWATHRARQDNVSYSNQNSGSVAYNTNATNEAISTEANNTAKNQNTTIESITQDSVSNNTNHNISSVE